MARDPKGGSDVGRGAGRESDDESPLADREGPEDLLTLYDPAATVSGHIRAPESTSSPVDAPEHDWAHARDLIYPAFRPIGTHGLALDSIDREALVGRAAQSHAQPLLDLGPAGLPVVYTIDAGGYDIVVNGDHLLSWGVEPSELQDAAMRNLSAWSATAPWTDEVSGERRLVSSDSGNGWDAARILVPEVIERLVTELGPFGRVLVGVPERHLLVAASLQAGDDDFVALFAEFIVEQSGGADEPIDRRVLEIVDGRLVEFSGIRPTA